MLKLETRRCELNGKHDPAARAKEDALASLFDQHYDGVVRYIFVRTGNQAEAEDLAGDVFLRAVKSLGSFRGTQEQMRFWVFRVAHNIVVDHYRKKSKRQTVPLDPSEVSRSPNVEDIVETNLQIAALSQALDQLTPAQREVIGLRFFAGLSSEEAGRVMGKSGGAVREMQRSAVEKLRGIMRC